MGIRWVNPCDASGGWSGSVSLSGTYLAHPTNDITYTVTCYGPAGSDSDSVTINVGTPNPVSLEAAPSTIFSGDNSTLTWTTYGMSSCDASATWGGSKATNGWQTVSPSSNKTYTITCEESGGTADELIDNGEFAGTVNEWTVSGDFLQTLFMAVAEVVLGMLTWPLQMAPYHHQMTGLAPYIKM